MTDWLEKGRLRRGLQPRRPTLERVVGLGGSVIVVMISGYVAFPEWPKDWRTWSPLKWLGIGLVLLVLEVTLEGWLKHRRSRRSL
jgi:hypothetical protein